MTTALIVDDHPGFRRLARKLLDSAAYLVVGDADDGALGDLTAAAFAALGAEAA